MYTHSLNPDGTIESICHTCYLTIGTASNETDLAASEDNHVCGRAPSEVRAAPNRDGGWRRHQDHRISLTIDILQTDADLAITFTEVAPTHIDVAKKAQSVNRARRAYEYIKSRRFTLPISDADAGELDSKLAILKRRLEALGEKF